MKIYVLFRQPHDTSLAPQALTVFDEYYAYQQGNTPDEIKEKTNRNFMENGVLDGSDDIFDWFEVDLGPVEAKIREALLPQKTPKLKGEVRTTPAAMPHPSITVRVGSRKGSIIDDEIK